jgi:hypothetical protein
MLKSPTKPLHVKCGGTWKNFFGNQWRSETILEPRASQTDLQQSCSIGSHNKSTGKLGQAKLGNKVEKEKG